MSPTSLGPASLAVGTRLGRYEIVGRVGGGGMGDVYRARDTHLPRSVAIKTLKLGPQGSEERRKRLEREARIVARLSHQHICRLYDFETEGTIDFLVMEYLDGETLSQRLRRGPLDPNEVIRLGSQIASALIEAHRHGVIHRDLKPSNVMLTGPGDTQDVRLLDFGIATRLVADPPEAAEPFTEEQLTREGQVVGTTMYMSPEQALGRKVDARSDIFALGTVLYEMISGRSPFAASSQAQVVARILQHEPALTSPPLATAAPADLVRIVDRCLAKNPKQRWQTASIVLRELERCRDRSSRPPTSETTLLHAGYPASAVGATEEAFESQAATVLATADVRSAAIRAGLIVGGLAAAAAALYLNNPSVKDALLYPLLVIIGALPVTLLTAAVGGLDVRAAATKIFHVLGSLGGATARVGQRWILGLSLFLFLGTVVSFLLGHAADGLMPHLTFLPHAEVENAEWALANPNDDWETYRTNYKTAFLAHTGGTEADFQDQKHSLGRGSIRAGRTLFSFGVILALAGTVDLFRSRHRRGWTSLIVGVVACLVLYSIWYTREGNYVREMVASSTRLPDQLRPELPDSAPEGLRRLAKGGP